MRSPASSGMSSGSTTTQPAVRRRFAAPLPVREHPRMDHLVPGRTLVFGESLQHRESRIGITRLLGCAHCVSASAIPS